MNQPGSLTAAGTIRLSLAVCCCCYSYGQHRSCLFFAAYGQHRRPVARPELAAVASTTQWAAHR